MNNKDFVQLHNHTEYSLLDGAQTVKRFVKGAADKGYKILAQTDHGNMDGLVKFNNECQANNIQPIYGCELYMLEHWDKRKDFKFKQRNMHMTVHAKNLKGLKALLCGLGYANLEGGAKKGYAWRPFLPMDYPLKNKDWHGNVIISTGCASSPFWNAKKGTDLLADYYEVFKDDLYAELMPIHDFPQQKVINKNAKDASKILGIKPIVTSDSHYLDGKDHKAHEVVLAISQRGITWNNPRRWKFDSKLSFLRDADDAYNSLRRMGLQRTFAKSCILNTREIGEKCNFVIGKIPVQLPRILKVGINERKYLIDTCAKELRERGLTGDVYWERLDKELNAIIGGRFTRYFLMVADLIRWAKESGIEVGPGRGSVGGSLVAYLLKITDVDPIKFGLIFERFISEGRIDLPDIDIDFEDRKRHMVEDYLKEKYGEWNVAHVSTFGMMKGKQAVRDVSRIFEVPRKEADEMSKSILTRPEQDSRASFSIMDTVKIFENAKRFYAKYPHVIKFAAKLEGQIKTTGVHAAGYVVSKYDLRKSGNCYLAWRRDKLSVNWDKKDIEQMGLMKLDVLGLSTLSVLSDCKESIKARHGKTIDYPAIPLDDKKTFEEVRKGNTVTAFQIGSKGLQKYCRDLDCSDFDTLVAASALWRPGCLKAGITIRYMNCKLGKEKPTYFNKVHKDITKDTFGQVIYQEQIMFMLYNMAGIPWKTTDQVRKTISKSEGTEKWQGYKELFARGCEKRKTMGYREAKDFFEKLKFFGQFAFNLSHAVEYGLISYWTMWLKTHYPTEFFCAYLNYGSVAGRDSASDEEKLDVALAEVKRMDVKVLSPDINKSGALWSIDGKGRLRAGIGMIKMVGDTIVSSLIDSREKIGGKFHSFKHFIESVERRRVNKRVVKMLIMSGALDSLFESKDEAKVWKIWYDELVEAIGTKIKLDNLVKDKLKTLDGDWDQKQDDVIIARQEAINYKVDDDAYGIHRKLVNLIRENLDTELIKDIDDSKKSEKVKAYVARATSIKFGYSERALKAAKGKGGTATALGGVYGNLDDGTSFTMAIYPPDLYKKKKEVIEKIKGEVGVFFATHPMAMKTNVWIKDFVLLKDIARGNPKKLELSIVKALQPFDQDKFKKEVKACTKCNLRESCKAPVPPSFGNLNIMVLGEAPGSNEDEQGRGFVGQAGRKLFEELDKVGIKRSDCIVSNVVNCRPPNNKLPNVMYVTRCPWTTKLIEAVRPRFILALGNSPLYYFKKLPKGIMALSGKTEWNNRAEAWVTYCIHPASVLYHSENLPLLRKSLKNFSKVVSRFV